MRVENPCDWVIERLRAGKPFFSVRVNDGEMMCMYKTQPEGKVLGTENNPQACSYALGDAVRTMLREAAGRDDVMVGHCCREDPRHRLNRMFWLEFFRGFTHEAGGHWPLDFVEDGSTRGMLEALRGRDTTLVACSDVANSIYCMGAGWVPSGDRESWDWREVVYGHCKSIIEFGSGRGHVFVWAGGGGLKPTAWRIYKEYPGTSHIDVGHLFNGAMEVMDYGWLQRQDGPWWEPYFRPGGFAEWVRSFAK